MPEKPITIRKFQFEDIALKVKWINDPNNNRFLHYELPLEVEKTRQWFLNNCNRTDRWDGTILIDGVPVGLIGLLNIRNGCAEYYITIGEPSYKGCGVATKASELLLEYAFRQLNLSMIYLTTEPLNVPAIRLYKKLGFQHKGEKNGQLLFEYTNPASQ